MIMRLQAIRAVLVTGDRLPPVIYLTRHVFPQAAQATGGGWGGWGLVVA